MKTNSIIKILVGVLLITMMLALGACSGDSAKKDGGNKVGGVFEADGTDDGAAEEFVGEKKTPEWNYDEETRTLTISGQGSMYELADVDNYGDYIVPWENLSEDIDKVIIENGITDIMDFAFSYSYCTSVAIPNSVKSIGDYAFAGSLIESVTIPKGVTSIGYAAFFDTQIQSIAFPDTLKSIGSEAFSSCYNIESITIPKSVTSIGDSAFSYSGIKHVVIYDGLTHIEKYMFEYSDLASITIPVSVTRIDDYAFDFCYDFEDIYYKGTKEQWEKISISDYASIPQSVTIHYNSK